MMQNIVAHLITAFNFRKKIDVALCACLILIEQKYADHLSCSGAPVLPPSRNSAALSHRWSSLMSCDAAADLLGYEGVNRCKEEENCVDSFSDIVCEA